MNRKQSYSGIIPVVVSIFFSLAIIAFAGIGLCLCCTGPLSALLLFVNCILVPVAFVRAKKQDSDDLVQALALTGIVFLILSFLAIVLSLIFNPTLGWA